MTAKTMMPTRAHVQFWADQAMLTCEPINITFRFFPDIKESEAEAKAKARKVQQVYSAMRASTRVITRKVQKNPAHAGPYDDVICEVRREDDRYIVRIEYMTEFDMEQAFEVTVGEGGS